MQGHAHLPHQICDFRIPHYQSRYGRHFRLCPKRDQGWTRGKNPPPLEEILRLHTVWIEDTRFTRSTEGIVQEAFAGFGEEWIVTKRWSARESRTRRPEFFKNCSMSFSRNLLQIMSIHQLPEDHNQRLTLCFREGCKESLIITVGYCGKLRNEPSACFRQGELLIPPIL